MVMIAEAVKPVSANRLTSIALSSGCGAVGPPHTAAAEHHRNNAAVAAFDGADKIEARHPRVAGLNPVHAFDAPGLGADNTAFSVPKSSLVGFALTHPPKPPLTLEPARMKYVDQVRAELKKRRQPDRLF